MTTNRIAHGTRPAGLPPGLDSAVAAQGSHPGGGAAAVREWLEGDAEFQGFLRGHTRKGGADGLSKIDVLAGNLHAAVTYCRLAGYTEAEAWAYVSFVATASLWFIENPPPDEN